MPSSSGDQTRVGRTLTLGGGAESSLDGRDIELSVSPKDIRTSPYDLCANRSARRQSREGDRWFESTSLRWGVLRELIFGAHPIDDRREFAGGREGVSRPCGTNDGGSSDSCNITLRMAQPADTANHPHVPEGPQRASVAFDLLW